MDKTGGMVFRLKEPLEREWTNEIVRFTLGEGFSEAYARCSGAEDINTGEIFAAQIYAPEGAEPELLVFIPRLEPGRELRLKLTENAAGAFAQPVYCREGKGVLSMGGEGFAVSLPTAESPGAPILAFKGVDGAWRGSGAFENTPALKSLSAKINARGPFFAEASLEYRFGDGMFYSVRVSARTGVSAVALHESFAVTSSASYVLDLSAGFSPDMINRRCHTASIGRGLGCEHRDNSFKIDRSIPGPYLLQPYHAWHLDAATWWSCYEENGGNDLVGFAMLDMHFWRRGMQVCPEIHTPPPCGTLAEFKLGEGSRAWALCLGDKNKDIASAPSKVPGRMHRDMIKLSHLPLNKVSKWNLDFFDSGAKLPSFPSIFTDRDRIDKLRKDAERNQHWRKYCTSIQEWIADNARTNGGHLDICFQDGDKGTPAVEEVGLALAGEAADKRRLGFYGGQLLKWLEGTADRFLVHGYNEHDNVGLAFSRSARTSVIIFDALASVGAFSDQQLRRCLKLWGFLTNVAADPDYWPREESDIYRGNPNFHTDMISAEAVMGGVLRGHPGVHERMRFCASEFRKEFARAVGPDGTWYECPLYELATLWWTLLGMYAIRNAIGEDLFQDERFKSCLGTLCDIQTPPDPRCGNRSVPPSVGDTTLVDDLVRHQCIFAWAAAALRDSDPVLAGKLSEAWRKAGAPYGARSVQIILAFQLGLDVPEPVQFIPASRHLPRVGAVIRNGGTFIHYKHGPNYQHYHADEGSFHWYWKGVPLCLDWASQYFPPTRNPWMHNRITLAHREEGERGQVLWWSDSEKSAYVVGRSVVLTDRTLPETPEDIAKVPWQRLPQYEPVASPISWTRHLMLVKGPDFLVIWDDLQGGAWSEFCLWTLANSCKRESPGHYFLEGQFPANLDVFFARPLLEDPGLGEWGYQFKCGWSERQLKIWAKADNRTGFLTALVPTYRGEKRPAVRADGKDAVIVEVGRAIYHVGISSEKPDGLQDINDMHWLGLRRSLRMQRVG